ncbi:phosphoribosylaminoimidazolesuccinocarboxamide synthase [Vicingaceae bacterium]|nr:phosphoribosylaminoimidazolesuccinocarboxamide synthase [Vicingaceae bacterium]MDB4062026.1 phosphoribosylaminoimidazolesuccinocarboxamide synthase [Vicingaceae bacterium]
MSEALEETDFQFENQTNVYHGKVRDVYSIGEEHLVMVASDRISAFDHILPKAIPFKGQVLNQIASLFLKATEDVVPNWVLSVPDENVTVGRRCETFPVEMVIRGYLSGHSWREYKAGRRLICGVTMPKGMKENDKFPQPIITPATKAEEGHDEDISREEIIRQGIVSEADYVKLEEYTRNLFQRGTEMANERNLILVDTKYEFGKVGDTIYLIDEIHTPDSSRYFYAEGYVERQKSGEKQKQLSKEFVREWLIENEFQGLDGQKMPEMPDSFVQLVSDRYIELYEQITGKTFIKADTTNVIDRINKNTSAALKQLN